MRCKKCGQKLRSNEIFCTVCGYYNGEAENDSWIEEENFNLIEDDYIELETENNTDYYLVNENKNNRKEKKKKKKKTKKEKAIDNIEEDNYIMYERDDSNNDEVDLLKSFIGEDYKMTKKFPFNIYAFIFNWIYFLYRKLYITGIIGLAIAALVILLYPIPKVLIVYLIITSIITGFVFNPYYIFIAKKRIDKIKDTYEGSDEITLSSICKEKGGVKIWPALLIFALFLLFIVISFAGAISINKNYNDEFWEENSTNKATCKSIVKLSYEELSKIPKKYGTVIEGICKISSSQKEYNIYLKANNGGENNIIYFIAKNKTLSYENDTLDIDLLTDKEKEGTIYPEEKEILNEKKSLSSTYKVLLDHNEQENNLINKKNNKAAKVYFVFNREEIIQ